MPGKKLVLQFNRESGLTLYVNGEHEAKLPSYIFTRDIERVEDFIRSGEVTTELLEFLRKTVTGRYMVEKIQEAQSPVRMVLVPRELSHDFFNICAGLLAGTGVDDPGVAATRGIDRQERGKYTGGTRASGDITRGGARFFASLVRWGHDLATARPKDAFSKHDRENSLVMFKKIMA